MTRAPQFGLALARAPQPLVRIQEWNRSWEKTPAFLLCEDARERRVLPELIAPFAGIPQSPAQIRPGQGDQGFPCKPDLRVSDARDVPADCCQPRRVAVDFKRTGGHHLSKSRINLGLRGHG